MDIVLSPGQDRESHDSQLVSDNHGLASWGPVLGFIIEARLKGLISKASQARDIIGLTQA